MKALIVDDEEDICYLLSGILKHKNLLPKFVNSLAEARTHLQQESPAIIFLDNHLPDGLGISFIEHIKQQHPSTKVVMITAHDTTSDRHKAQQLGVDFFIGKPFTRETIYNALDRVLN